MIFDKNYEQIWIIFYYKPEYYVNRFWYIVSAISYSKNYGSLTLQTKFKVELSMGDLTCLFWDSSYS